MKKLFLLLSAVAISSLYAAESVPEAATVKGTVNVSDFLNVRLGPGLRHPVTGRLNGGQEVEITHISGNWLELKAPENLKIYVCFVFYLLFCFIPLPLPRRRYQVRNRPSGLISFRAG